MAVIPRTAGGLIKPRPARPGSRVALVAPASPFDTDMFHRGVAELERLGFSPVWDDRVFERKGFVAGTAGSRAASLNDAWRSREIDAIIAVRGGWGSMQTLPHLDLDAVRHSRTAFVGYSDVTSLHVWLHRCAGLASIHGPMLDGRLADGERAYDRASLVAALSTEPQGDISRDDVDVLQPGEATGPLFGGTMTQLLASLGTPFAFDPPDGAVLFLEDIGERPYRLDRMLTQLRQSGLLGTASALIFGQMPKCDEPGGVTAHDTIRDAVSGFSGPIVFGYPSGHTVTPLVTLGLGVRTRVVAAARATIIIDESVASE